MSKQVLLSAIFFVATTCSSLWSSELVDTVVKMSKEGGNASAMLAYVEKSNLEVSVSADDIALMEQNSVPANVIEAVLNKENGGKTAAVASVANDSIVAPSDDQADISYFYESLSPHGTWTNDNEYGWVWTPTIVTTETEWRPYVDNGQWVYTDQGWMWTSSYEWGWAPFHYGRWAHRDHWVRVPDNVWGPAWVSWRYSDNYYGWAPLTPRARFEAGVGFNIGNGNFDVGIGIGVNDYAFVPSGQFFATDLHHHMLPRTEVTKVYNQTTIINKYTTNNNRVINEGIPTQQVARATKREIKPINVVDRKVKPGEAVAGTKIENNRVEVFRPELRAKASGTPQEVIARRGQAGAKRHEDPSKQVGTKDARPPEAPARQSEQEVARKTEAVKRIKERAAQESQQKPKTAEVNQERKAETAAQRQQAQEAQKQKTADATQERKTEADAQRERAQEAQKQKTAEATQQRKTEADTREQARETQKQKTAEATQERKTEADAQRERTQEAQKQKTAEAVQERKTEADTRAQELEANRNRIAQDKRLTLDEEQKINAERQKVGVADPKARTEPAPRVPERREPAPQVKQEPKERQAPEPRVKQEPQERPQAQPRAEPRNERAPAKENDTEKK